MANKVGIQALQKMLALGFKLSKVAIEAGKDGYQVMDVFKLLQPDVQESLGDAIAGIKSLGVEIQDIDRYEIEALVHQLNLELDDLNTVLGKNTDGSPRDAVEA